MGIQLHFGIPRRDSTKLTTASADVSEQHEGRRPTRPTLSNIGAFGFLTNRVEFFFRQELFDLFERRSPGGWDLEPFGFGSPPGGVCR